MSNFDKYNPEDEWNKIWKSIICNQDGSINIEQLKKELCDFSVLIDNSVKVYNYCSGNKLSYSTYSAETVINCMNDHLEDLQKIWEEDFREENDCKCGLEKK